jgi:hypothetical protein
LKSVGSSAIFDPTVGELRVAVNPWKRYVETGKWEISQEETSNGIRMSKGDCLWLDGKQGPGWYRIIEMSPAKKPLFDTPKEAKLKVVPAWVDLWRWVAKQAQEKDETQRRKIGQNLLEKEVNGKKLADLHAKGLLTIRKGRSPAPDVPLPSL